MAQHVANSNQTAKLHQKRCIIGSVSLLRKFMAPKLRTEVHCSELNERTQISFSSIFETIIVTNYDVEVNIK